MSDSRSRLDAPVRELDDVRPRLSLRMQLTLWFLLTFGVVQATVVTALAVLLHGELDAGVLQVIVLTSVLALVGAGVAAWVVLGKALEPLHQIARSARAVQPERIDEQRIDVEDVGSEVAEARAELNRALDRIEAGYDALETFIRNVSHELKTPIATVLAEARLLLMRARTEEEYRGFTESAADEMARLGKLVESFLTLARMDYEEGRRQIDEVWFQDVLVEAAARCQALAETHRVRLSVQLPEDLERTTWGEPELLSSMFENILRNAIRFSPEQATVHLDASVQSGGELRVNVRDQGPGMPEEVATAVFEPFVQAEEETRLGRGSGLGLSIARRVAMLHRGGITAANAPDGGCLIEVRLPFLDEADWRAESGGAAPGSSGVEEAGARAVERPSEAREDRPVGGADEAALTST